MVFLSIRLFNLSVMLKSKINLFQTIFCFADEIPQTAFIDNYFLSSNEAKKVFKVSILIFLPPPEMKKIFLSIT